MKQHQGVVFKLNIKPNSVSTKETKNSAADEETNVINPTPALNMPK